MKNRGRIFTDKEYWDAFEIMENNLVLKRIAAFMMVHQNMKLYQALNQGWMDLSQYRMDDESLDKLMHHYYDMPQIDHENMVLDMEINVNCREKVKQIHRILNKGDKEWMVEDVVKILVSVQDLMKNNP